MTASAAGPAPATLAFLPAALADVATVVALVESAYRGEASRSGWTTEAHLLHGQRTDAAAIRELLGSGILLARYVGETVGCCQIEPRAGGAYFGLFAVRPTLQSGGIGTTLLAEAERIARGQLQAAWLELTVLTQRVDLIAWYERRGYARTGEQRPFPYGDKRFGIPLRPDLAFDILRKPLS